MPCRHASSSLEALFRVFVQPALKSPIRVPRCPPQLQSPSSRTYIVRNRPLQLHNGSLQQIRCFTKPKPRPVTPEKNRPSCDEEIGTARVNIVTANGQFIEAQPMQSVLRMYDRTTHTLMQLQAGDQTAPGNVREHWPVAKLISHDELREMGAKKREQIKNQKTSAASGKEVEFSWAIGENDLGHRLKKIRQFFEEGRKVDVTLSFSKRNRAVTEKECEDLLAKLRRVLGAVDGAREFKEPEGKIGKLYTMYWEAKKKKG